MIAEGRADNVVALRPGGDDDEVWPDPSLYAADDPAPCIPDGLYDARVSHAEVVEGYFKTGKRADVPLKLVLTFKIISGQYAGTELPFYAVLPKKVESKKARIQGRLLSPRSRFYRAWTVAAGGPPCRHDRMPLTVFKNRLFQIRTRTVVSDRSQRDLPKKVQESVVDMVMERLA